MSSGRVVAKQSSSVPSSTTNTSALAKPRVTACTTRRSAATVGVAFPAPGNKRGRAVQNQPSADITGKPADSEHNSGGHQQESEGKEQVKKQAGSLKNFWGTQIGHTDA
uniref:Uncharacterized protein n=1 Tax=Ditylenchus dipsaci TaxID=166011 RepID=A0A915CR00_9BILA